MRQECVRTCVTLVALATALGAAAEAASAQNTKARFLRVEVWDAEIRVQREKSVGGGDAAAQGGMTREVREAGRIAGTLRLTGEPRQGYWEGRGPMTARVEERVITRMDAPDSDEGYTIIVEKAGTGESEVWGWLAIDVGQPTYSLFFDPSYLTVESKTFIELEEGGRKSVEQACAAGLSGAMMVPCQAAMGMAMMEARESTLTPPGGRAETVPLPENGLVLEGSRRLEDGTLLEWTIRPAQR